MSNYYHFYSFKKHRKLELIEKAIKKGKKRSEANELTIRDLCKFLEQEYVPLNNLPKPSHRKPLPIHPWIIPEQYKVYITMSPNFQKIYEEWENTHKPLFLENEEDFYREIDKQYNAHDKCPKIKWLKKYILDHPEESIVFFISPEKYKIIKDQIDFDHDCLTSRVMKKPIRRFANNEVKCLIIAMNYPPYHEIPDCTWIHTISSSLQSHKRYASKHLYINLIKSNELDLINNGIENIQNIQNTQNENNPIFSLDLFRLLNPYEDENQE